MASSFLWNGVEDVYIQELEASNRFRFIWNSLDPYNKVGQVLSVR